MAHFHYVVAGIIFAMFAAIYFWFPKMFGRTMSHTWGVVHFIGTYIFFNLTFFPMHFLGVGRAHAPDLQPHAVRVPGAV